MGTASKYLREVRERAVQLVWEHQNELRLRIDSEKIDRCDDRVHNRDAA
jgi:hypothetical protein